MARVTKELHQRFLEPFRGRVTSHGDLDSKPLEIDLALPYPPRLRLYMYSLVDGTGSKRRDEYKAVLRLRGQETGTYESFDHSSGRLALLVGYRADLDVFVLWDASLHPRFKNGGNIQIRAATVHTAAATGRAEQMRTLTTGLSEVVIACQSWNLVEAVHDRVAWTGGTSNEEWTRSPT
jgi:hypothetical protein